jgi:hypothetical protein
MKKNKIEHLDSLIEGACSSEEPFIIQITSLKDLYELSGMGGAGSAHGHGGKKEKKNLRNELKTEMMLRQYINKKAKKIFKQKRRDMALQEMALRKVIRSLLKEGDVSDVHPHRSTGINVLEDVLKKSIPTLRADYKRLTTDKTQRQSFRAHIIKAIEDQLKPSLVNDQFPMNHQSHKDPSEPGENSGIGGEIGGETGTLEEPPAQGGELDVGLGGAGEAPEEEIEQSPEDAEFADELAALEEAGIEVDIEDPPEEKKIDVDGDSEPSDEEQFGTGLEGLDETGRNMAYTSFRKVSQYILDAYDSLANMQDKEVFVDYLITNLKLYFDKFEDELQKSVEEPTTDQYEQAAEEGSTESGI